MPKESTREGHVHHWDLTDALFCKRLFSHFVMEAIREPVLNQSGFMPREPAESLCSCVAVNRQELLRFAMVRMRQNKCSRPDCDGKDYLQINFRA